jgi:hypothetical protein
MLIKFKVSRLTLHKVRGGQRVRHGAIGRRFKERQGELLVNDTNIEVNDTRAGFINANTLDGEPKEEFLGGDSREVGDVGLGKVEGDVGVVVELVLEIGDARVREGDLVEGGGGCEGELGYVLWEETRGETIAVEVVVDGCVGGGGDEEEEKEREDEKVEENLGTHFGFF